MGQLSKIIRQNRIAAGLTLSELAESSGISPSHLGRIERGECLPSASVLRKLAEPLGFEESELFTLAGFLSPTSPEGMAERPWRTTLGLDPYVARVLSQEPVEIQRSVIGILALLKSLARSVAEEASGST